MKKIVSFFILLVFTISCEKDDICADGTLTTSQLIVTFYDNNNRTQKKEVTDLFLFAVNDDNDPVLFRNSIIKSVDSIAFPLRTDKNLTRVILYNQAFVNDGGTPDDSNDDFIDTLNQDIIDFSYIQNDIYVSRACGYKAVFTELSDNLETDINNWILDIEIVNPTVENEQAAHIKVFH
jgi:hypothetical protein